MLGLAETKVDDSVSDASISIPGFELFRRDRTRHGGGVALYVRSSLCPFLECSHSDLEALVVKLRKPNIYFTVVYLPPSCDAATRNSMRKFISNFASLRNIVVGDFNIDAMSNSETSSAFIDLLQTSGFVQLITEFTRVTNRSSSCIDLLFTNCRGNLATTGVAKIVTSDHYAIFGVYSSKDLTVPRSADARASKYEYKTIEYRNLKYLSPFDFSDCMARVKFDSALPVSDSAIENNTLDIIKALRSVTDEVAPLKKKKIMVPRNPWFRPYLQRFIEDRDQSHKKWDHSRHEDDWRVYRHYRSKVNAEIKKCKAEYYREELNNASQNPKKWWQIVQNIGDFKCASLGESSDISADDFNEYFANVAATLVTNANNNAQDANPEEPLSGAGVEGSLARDIPRLTTAECSRCVSSLRNTSPGPDGVYTVALKYAIHAPNFLSALTDCYNSMIDTGVYPHCLKVGRICAAFKNKGERDAKENYRPICIASCLSKVFETHIALSVRRLLSDTSFLTPFQSGFRPGHSCETALLSIVEDVVMARDKGNLTGMVFLDLSKAFDVVDHALLLQKCMLAGLSDKLVALLRSFLANRKQYVALNGVNSRIVASPSYGVPQGSVLGPLLFTIYVNSLPSVLSTCSVHCYADDVTLWFSSKKSEAILHELQQGVNEVVKWFHCNKLFVNGAKTKWMMLGTSQKLSALGAIPDINLDDQAISRVHSFTLLGLTLDPELHFETHAARLRRNIGGIISKIGRVRHILRIDEVRVLINAFVLSRIRYCLSIYGSALTLKEFNKIEVIYNRVLRTSLLVKDFRMHLTDLYRLSDMPNLPALLSMCLVSIAHSVVYKSAPPYLFGFYTERRTSRATRSSTDNKVTCRTRFKMATCQKKSVSFNSAKVWNSLTKDVRDIKSRHIFLTCIKRFNL